ncbi:cysteine--tRNA ligase [Methylocapsa aurea]|uniref:cysteine--tRNA ligase n=1 Tax=Methylocapsa aurea TaxID=663610 RepID=UPI00055A610A|nr:cysteine--tRNA ligase [Methylocapsa aurea]
MSLRLYNTLTRQKQDFEPIDRANVRLYACGPTVYDHLHIGNGRMLIVFDVLFRLLRHVYGAEHVKYVRNITDVDDKINARAAERGVDIGVLTDEMTAIFHEDAAALGCLPPTVEPRATKHMAEMIAIIEKLIAKGHAYVAEGHVLFDVPSMPDYGKLSKRPLDDMIAGARVEVAPYKRGPMDFVLWKPSSESEPGWESPWGRGRPGWHIECSAMSWKHLGETFDIHGGGIDLVFPHHENEVAQTCCAFGHDVMANIWMHNGHLQVEGEKMSKSLGNFVTIHELLHTNKFGGRSWPGEVLRLAMLKTHYRQPIDFTVKALDEAYSTCVEWFLATDGVDGDAKVPEPVLEALQDDLNTPAAFAAIHMLHKGTRAKNLESAKQLKASLELLGVLPQEEHFKMWRILNRSADEIRVPDTVKLQREYLQTIGRSEREVDGLIAARNAARGARNWAESDRIRDELEAMGVALKDNKDGTTSWEPKR